MTKGELLKELEDLDDNLVEEFVNDGRRKDNV